MNIVQIEDFFHPEAGYQVNVLSKYFANFGHRVTIVTFELDSFPKYLTDFFGKDKIEEKDVYFEKKYGVKIIRLPVKKYISGRVVFDGRQMIKTIKEVEPDVLFVHGNDTYSGIWTTLNRKKIDSAIIMDSHMVDIASKNKFSSAFKWYYRHFITPIIKKNNIHVIRTADDDYVSRCLGIPLEQAEHISFGADTMLFHPDENIRREYREKNKIEEEEFVILYAGKLDEAKGGEFLASITDLEFAKKIVFLIIGSAIGDYGDNLEKRFANSKNRIIRFETQKYIDLYKYYNLADLAVIPKQCSLSLYDMNASGLPVLAEDNSINCSRLSHNNGWTFKSGNLEDVKKCIDKIIKLDRVEYCNIKRKTSEWINNNYNYEIQAKKYEEMLFRVRKEFEK